MGKNFSRVKDPERAKDGDIVLFPKGERRLNISPRTFADLGISMGSTCRSHNSPETVRQWLCRGSGLEARAFMITGADYQRAPTAAELLLTMDAVPKRDSVDPRIRIASLVPFGPAPNRDWKMEQWASCWNTAHDDAVASGLLRLLGDAGALHSQWPRTCVVSPDDLFATQAWDGLACCTGRSNRSNQAEDWLPTRRHGNGHADLDSYSPVSLMAWGGIGWGCKSSRIRFKAGFLEKLAARGALVLRPTEGFVRDTTESIVEWACRQIAARFSDRVNASKVYLKGLADDVKRDTARVKLYNSAARKSGPGTTRQRKALAELEVTA